MFSTAKAANRKRRRIPQDMSFLSRKQAERENALEVEAPRVARVTAPLYGCSAAFVAASIALPHTPAADTDGLWLVALIATTASISIYALAEQCNTWTNHIFLLVASGLIATCIALSASASSIYAAMYIGVVLVAARSFSVSGLVVQLVGVLATYGIALSTLTTAAGEFGATTRWLPSVVAISLTGFIVQRLVSSSRKNRAALIQMSGMPEPEDPETDGSIPHELALGFHEVAAPPAGSLAGQGR
jgi:hypothetical protein